MHVYADLQDPLGTIDADFGYQVLLHVSAGTSLDLFNEVMTVHADKGVLVQDGHNTTTGVLLWFAGDLEPTFRGIVADQAQRRDQQRGGARRPTSSGSGHWDTSYPPGE